MSDASQKLNIVFCLLLNVYWCGFIYECHFFRPKYGEYFFCKNLFSVFAYERRALLNGNAVGMAQTYTAATTPNLFAS